VSKYKFFNNSKLKNIWSPLQAFEPLWGEEGKQTLRDLSRLNPEEAALYDDLRDNRIRKNLRLEQETISFGYVEAALSALT
jgi:hypothetical protein